MPKFEDLLVMLAAAGVVISAGLFFSSRRAVASGPAQPPSGAGWLNRSDGATTAASRWASIPDSRSDYSVIFTQGMTTGGNVIDVAHANTEGGYQ